MALVLLAEPSVPVAGALRRYLEGAGHEVLSVSSAEEALRAGRVRPPALVLAAGTGPLDGEALCRELRAQGHTVPVLLLYPPQEDYADERATEAGADGCLVGPLKRANVLTCVALLLQREEARRGAAEAASIRASSTGSPGADLGLTPGPYPIVPGQAVAADEDFGALGAELVAPGEGPDVAPGVPSGATPRPGLGLTPGAFPSAAPGAGGAPVAGSGAAVAHGASFVGADVAPGLASGASRGAGSASVTQRASGFAITPVPGSLTTLEPEGRRITRPELPAVGTSPDFEFLKRLMLMEVKRSRRYRYPIALLLVELDRFPERSAALSPAARTAVLAEALGLLVAGVRDIDVAVPFADSRYVVFLPHTPRSGALVVAGRLRERVGTLRGLPGATASVGVAVSEPPGGKAPASGAGAQVSFGSLLKEAGEALRRAQAAGGDRVEPAGGKPQPG